MIAIAPSFPFESIPNVQVFKSPFKKGITEKTRVQVKDAAAMPPTVRQSQTFEHLSCDDAAKLHKNINTTPTLSAVGE